MPRRAVSPEGLVHRLFHGIPVGLRIACKQCRLIGNGLEQIFKGFVQDAAAHRGRKTRPHGLECLRLQAVLGKCPERTARLGIENTDTVRSRPFHWYERLTHRLEDRAFVMQCLRAAQEGRRRRHHRPEPLENGAWPLDLAIEACAAACARLCGAAKKGRRQRLGFLHLIGDQRPRQMVLALPAPRQQRMRRDDARPGLVCHVHKPKPVEVSTGYPPGKEELERATRRGRTDVAQLVMQQRTGRLRRHGCGDRVQGGERGERLVQDLCRIPLRTACELPAGGLDHSKEGLRPDRRHGLKRPASAQRGHIVGNPCQMRDTGIRKPPRQFADIERTGLGQQLVGALKAQELLGFITLHERRLDERGRIA